MPAATENEGVTRELAAFLARTTYDDLPSEIVEHAKRCILDFLGVAIAGSTLENSKILAHTAKEWGGIEDATVVGFPFRLPAPAAGLVNGATGHAIQMDDTEWITVAHIGTEVVPAAMALAERKHGITGREFINAVVVGYEAAIRIGAAVNPSHNRRGFSPNGTLGVFGAAAAAGKVLNLHDDQMADAIGLAAMQSSGLEEFCYDGSMSAILNTGHATQSGIIAALLAERCFTGSRNIIEGKSGFARAYSDEFDLSRVTAGLGEKYGIADVWFKRYPTCAYCNSTLDIVLNLKELHGIGVDDVQGVEVKTFPVVERTVNNPEPDNFTAAMLSLPYSVAMALREGKVTPEEFDTDWWADPEVKGLMRKVSITVAEEELLEAGLERNRGAIVNITCTDGSRYGSSARAPKGDPVYPFTDDELLHKYQALAGHVFDGQKIDAIASLVQDLENVSDTVQLTTLLAHGQAEARLSDVEDCTLTLS